VQDERGRQGSLPFGRKPGARQPFRLGGGRAIEKQCEELTAFGTAAASKPLLETAPHPLQFRPGSVEALVRKPVDSRRQSPRERRGAIRGIPEGIAVRQQQVESAVAAGLAFEGGQVIARTRRAGEIPWNQAAA